jgi:diguanylate cyclase (GGDEF)-like protein
LRRLLTSWVALTGLLLVLCAAVGMVVNQLQAQSEKRAQAEAIQTAHIVADLVVRRNIDPADITGTFPIREQERADMDADVAVMLRRDRIVGLEVWRNDGSLLYADKDHPAGETDLPADELRMLERPGAEVLVINGSRRGSDTLDIFLPYETAPSSSRSPRARGIVEVLTPRDAVAAGVARSTRSLYALAVVFLAVLVAVLLVLRRRLLLREHQALHDSLTGLLNRVALREQLRQAVVRAQQDHGALAALLVLDLDGFKAVNDTLGHPAGDALLIQVAQTLRRSLRPTDVVARFGGDEFAVLLTHLPDAASAQSISSQLLAKLRAGSYTVHGIELAVDASIGIALIPEHGKDTDLLVQRADVAMYQAKRANSGVTVYDETTDPHDVTQLGLLVELRRAIEQDELVLHYQPKARLDTRDLQGVEALVRWQHPARGLLGPDKFVPLAEHTGLMQPLTEWVLHRAIHQAALWRDLGLMLPVAVNLSPRSLLDGDLAATVLTALADANLPAHLLELEITETAIMTDPDRAVVVLRHLNAMGIRVAIDDFGVGYTSLNYLKSLPVHTLKIDRAFITHMLSDRKDQAIAESVIGLAHKLGLSVLAEGIETEDVWQRLKDLNCDEGQGYYLARPMPAHQLAAWVRTHLAVVSSTPTAPARTIDEAAR